MFFEAMVVFNLAVLFYLYYALGNISDYLNDLGDSLNELWKEVDKKDD